MMPQKEFEAFLDQTSGALDTEELKINFDHAKEFLGDNYFYSIAPGSRLGYIQEKLKEKGVKDFTETGADSHRIATIMQLIYGLDTSVPEPSALMFMFGPFMIDTMKQLGMLSENPDGSISVPDKAQAEIESLPIEDRLKMEAEAKTAAQEAFGNPETGDLSEENLHTNYEARNFDLPGHLSLPAEMQPNIEILRQKYIEKFGKPEKLGRYICPVDTYVIKFCSSIIEKETGKKVPETRFLIDHTHDAPYLHRKDVVIPAIALADDGMLVQCITAELPHLMFEPEELNIQDFEKDRIGFFKRSAWSEGVPLRLEEKILEEYINKTFATVSPATIIINIAKQGVPLHAMHPAYIKVSGLDTVMQFSVYNGMSYLYGWHFVRQLDGKQFRKHLDYEKPWDSKKLGWNKKPLSSEDFTAMEKLYAVERAASEIRYEGALKEDAYNAMIKAFDQWKADFLPSQKA
jgi:hypothetical protein